MARLDNPAGSPWLNIKLGKFELDNLVSEKRILTLTSISGVYQTYHFLPQGANIFGQIGTTSLASNTWDTRRTTAPVYPPRCLAPAMAT